MATRTIKGEAIARGVGGVRRCAVCRVVIAEVSGPALASRIALLPNCATPVRGEYRCKDHPMSREASAMAGATVRIRGPIFRLGELVTYHGGLPGSVESVKMIGPVGLGADNEATEYQRIKVNYACVDERDECGQHVISREGAAEQFQAAK